MKSLLITVLGLFVLTQSWAQIHVPITPIRVSVSSGLSGFVEYEKSHNWQALEGFEDKETVKYAYLPIAINVSAALSKRVSLGVTYEFNPIGSYFNHEMTSEVINEFTAQHDKYNNAGAVIVNRGEYGGGEYYYDLQQLKISTIGVFTSIDLFKGKHQLFQPYVAFGLNYVSRAFVNNYDIHSEGVSISYNTSSGASEYTGTYFINPSADEKQSIKDYIANDPVLSTKGFTDNGDGYTFTATDGTEITFNNQGHVEYNQEHVYKEYKTSSWQWSATIGTRIAISSRFFADLQFSYASIFTNNGEAPGVNQFNNTVAFKAGVGYTFGRFK